MRTGQKVYSVFKRIIGFLGSIPAIILSAVLFWWWIIPVNAIVTKGHPFFARHRIGKNGKPFRCLKFRSMRVDADPHMTSRQGETEQCLTKFGKFLRATSLDETPQFLNVFIGQMAFIGPRPLIDVSEDVITINLRKENGAIALRPGLSGYAQIHKRGDLDPVQKAIYDGVYFKHFSLWWDTKIFIYTMLRIFGVAKGR